MTTVIPAYIDEEINKYLTLVSDLRAKKNSYLPIFRLPPETLADIFVLGARDSHENGDYILLTPPWVNVSYVCRHWRNVALNCPTLWTYHFTRSLRWTEELLARSKQAPLKISINFDPFITPSWLSALVEKLLGHVERIQELRLRVAPTVLPSNISLRAPLLQILDVEGIPTPYGSEWASEISDEDIPLLRTLKLTECCLPWQSFNLSGVTTLLLCRIPPQSQQDIPEFIATLGRMQALIALHLEAALPTARTFLSKETFDAKISLPCLARLILIAPLSAVVAFMSCVNVPLKTEVRLNFKCEDDSSINDFAQISRVVAQRFIYSRDLSSLTPTIHSLSIRFPLYRPTFALSVSEHDACDPRLLMTKPQWDCGVPLVVAVGMERQSLINREHIVSDICCSIPPTDVDTFHVNEPPLSVDFWRKTLGHLRGIRNLILTDGDMPNLVPLLTLPADELVETPRRTSNCNRTPHHKFIPALEVLELRYITFALDDSPGDTISEKLLVDALSSRKAHRPRLSMVSCGVEDIYDESDTED